MYRGVGKSGGDGGKTKNKTLIAFRCGAAGATDLRCEREKLAEPQSAAAWT